jgi:ribosomal protein S18 acetylase RimI-like enzyme
MSGNLHFKEIYAGENLVFSLAGKADIEEIEMLVNGAYRGESSKRGWTTEADYLDGQRTDAESLEQMLLAPSCILTCRDRDQKTLLGCVYLKPDGNSLYLGMLTVSPPLQARGIGKKLLTEAENRALELGLSGIRMTVLTLRKELLDWYERHGYSKTGERRPFPNDPRFGLPREPLEFFVLEKNLLRTA